jgi:agmatinase
MLENWDFMTAPADSFAGVLFPTPGGLTFYETADLVDEISHISPIRGICLFEVRPELDFNDMTASTAAHLLINFIGTLAKHRHTNGPSS